MSQEMIALQVKCYLLPENARVNKSGIAQATEIRRFVLTHSWTGLYEELLNKLTNSYAGFIKAKTSEEARAQLSTYWQDEESELVGFTSDDEMRYANDLLVAFARSKAVGAQQQPPHVFKVYVANREAAAKAPEPSVHHGVVCDGCGVNGIVGSRWKCTVCPDYDLCGRCESSGVHKETSHTLKQIEQRRFPHHWGGRGGPWGMGGGCTRGGQRRSANNFFDNLGKYVPQMANAEELKKFGENFKSFMEPFGVDVDYFVDNNTKKSEETPKAEEAATSSKPTEEKKEEAKSAEATAPQHEAAAAAFAPFLDMMKNINVADVLQEFQKASTPVEESFVNVEVDHERERELKVVQALEALKAMGYSDDGGWLTRLTIAKHGNINAVLDAIAPK